MRADLFKYVMLKSAQEVRKTWHQIIVKTNKKKPKDEKQNREHTNLTKFYIRWKVKKVTKKKMRNMLLSIISLLESVVIEWVSCELWISCASDITQSAFPRYLTRHLNNWMKRFLFAVTADLVFSNRILLWSVVFILLLFLSKSWGGSRTAATSKMELFVIIVNALIMIAECPISDAAAVLDPPMKSLIQNVIYNSSW